MKFGVLEEFEQSLASGWWNHLVFAPVNDQRGLLEGSNRPLVRREPVHALLTRGWEHRRERFLKARANAGAITQLCQFVVHQSAIVGEDVEQTAHRVDRGFIAPDGV